MLLKALLKHWGVLCFNTVTQTVYFDDGLMLSPTRDTIILIENMLSGFNWLSNHECNVLVTTRDKGLCNQIAHAIEDTRD